MVSNFEGKFIMRGFGGLVEDDSNVSLGTMLNGVYKSGDVVEVSIRIKRVGTRPLCDAKTTYGTCREPLNADGTCNSASNHKSMEVDEVAA